MDSIFSGYVEDGLDFLLPDGRPDLAEPLGHLTLILGMAWLMAGALLYALPAGGPALRDAPRRRTGDELCPCRPSPPPPLRIGFVEGATVPSWSIPFVPPVRLGASLPTSSAARRW